MFKIFRVSIENLKFEPSQTADFFFLSPLSFSLPSLSSPLTLPSLLCARAQALERACARCLAAPLPRPRCLAAAALPLRAADAPPLERARCPRRALPLTLTPRQEHGDAPPRRRGAQTGRPCPAEPRTAAGLHYRALLTPPNRSLRPDPPSRPPGEHATARPRARRRCPSSTPSPPCRALPPPLLRPRVFHPRTQLPSPSQAEPSRPSARTCRRPRHCRRRSSSPWSPYPRSPSVQIEPQNGTSSPR